VGSLSKSPEKPIQEADRESARLADAMKEDEVIVHLRFRFRAVIAVLIAFDIFHASAREVLFDWLLN
jgi:hypothetical protein